MHEDGVGLGLLSYPVLMSADILLYKGTHVPVGNDQLQHLELCRDIADQFNKRFGKGFFPLPVAQSGAVLRVMSLKDGNVKMSKSDPAAFSRINITDSNDLISQKIKRCKTDSISGVTFDEIQRPELANLLRIFAAVTGNSINELVKEYGTKEKIAFKHDLTEALCCKIQPIAKRIIELKEQPDLILASMKLGGERARDIADATMREVKAMIGL